MKIILSCTTTYERRELFYYGLQSLLRQTVKPDLFVVNISKKTFLEEVGKTELPDWLLSDDIFINDTEDIGPYTKLLPTLRYAEADDLIITVDDDILYGRTLIEDLINLYEREPDTIVCSRARKMEKNMFNTWKNYSQWSAVKENVKGLHLLPLGMGGVLYQKKLLDLDFLKDKMFLKIAPTTDDLWYKMASLRKEVPVTVSPKIYTTNKKIKHTEGLQNINLSWKHDESIALKGLKYFKNKMIGNFGINQTKNDLYWDAICEYSGFKG